MMGVEDISREGLSYWDGVNLGEVVWKDDFDLSPPINQVYLHDFCQELKNSDFVYQ